MESYKMRLGFSLICIFCMINSLKSFVEFVVECPLVEDLAGRDDFDWNRMLGEWFIYGMYTYRNNTGYLPPKCAYENFYRFDEHTYLRCFKERYQRISDYDSEEKANAIFESRLESHYLMFNTSSDGSFRQCMYNMSGLKLDFEEFNQEGSCFNYRILDTDYENFAVHYLCDDWSEFFYDVPDQIIKGMMRTRYDTNLRYEVWIATRDEYPSNEIVEKAKDVFRKNDIRTDQIILIDHHCRGVNFANMTHPGENEEDRNANAKLDDSDNEDSLNASN